jgi:hypothetical protein
MSRDSVYAPQLPLFVPDTVGYPEALIRYEAMRPVLKGERSLRRQYHQAAWRSRTIAKNAWLRACARAVSAPPPVLAGGVCNCPLVVTRAHLPPPWRRPGVPEAPGAHTGRPAG